MPGSQGRENVRHSKNGKTQPASIVAIRHNVRFEAQKRTPSQKKRNFLIAPTICMKTKEKFRQGSIAPTILMKINELLAFGGRCHDVDEKTCGCPIN